MQAAVMTPIGGGDGIMHVARRFVVYGCAAGRVQTGTSGYPFTYSPAPTSKEG